MNTPDLLPCPFCGGRDVRQDMGEPRVRCKCGAEGPSASDGSQKRGRTLWNTRPGEAAAEARGREKGLREAANKVKHMDNGKSDKDWLRYNLAIQRANAAILALLDTPAPEPDQ